MRKNSFRFGVLLVAVAAMSLGSAGVATGGGHTAPLDVSPLVLSPGETLTFAPADDIGRCISGFPQDEMVVNWSLHGPDGSFEWVTRSTNQPEPVQIDAEGNWSVSVQVPPEFALGTYELDALCQWQDPNGPLTDVFWYELVDIELVEATNGGPPIEPIEPIEAAPRFTG